MAKKIVSIIIVLIMMCALLISCGNDLPDPFESSETDINIGYDFIVKIGGEDFKAEYLNGKAEGSISVFNRYYKNNGAVALTVECGEAETLLSVCPDSDNEFSVAEMAVGSGSVHIPVNGFVLSMQSDLLDNVRCDVGSVAKITGYEQLITEKEDLSYATFCNADNMLVSQRRINVVDPLDELFDGKIYLITSDYAKTVSLPENSVTYLLEQTTAYGYNVISSDASLTQSAPDEGLSKLVLCGDYNIAYGKEYLKIGERVMISNINKANSYTDDSAILIEGNLLKFDKDKINTDNTDDEGIYLYDVNYKDRVTPASDNSERLDIVIANGIVAQINNKGVRTLIPAGNGVVITAIGKDNVAKTADVNVGYRPETFFIDTAVLTQKYALINGYVFNIDIIDGLRQPEGVCVLYTPAYGKSTGSNIYGSEIIIEDGVVKEINKNKGDSDIPENGFVLSIHKDNSAFSYLKLINVGDKVDIVTSGPDYSVTNLVYNSINGVRSEDTLVIYKNKSRTGTNEYGYEILVDASGTVIGESNTGNATIPDGGFVLSGHGKNAEALRTAYAYGEKVFVDSETQIVTIIRTPEVKIALAVDKYNEAVDAYEEAKSKLLNIEYTAISDKLNGVKALVDETERALAEFDYVTAMSCAENVSLNLERIDYAFIESHVVENRSMWYRSTEKSDDEVRETLERMKSYNVNAIYLETWYDGQCIGYIDVDGVEHNSRNNGDYDALEGFVRIGHELGIEVHAWVENFFIGYVSAFNAPNGNADTFTSLLATKYADKLLLDKAGRNYFYYTENASFVFMNPFDAECREVILEVYKQIVTKYDIDGLHLDYIRFPEINYIDGKSDFGYNDDIIAAFQKKTGLSSDPHNYASGSEASNAWIEFRCDIISSFVKEVHDAVLKIDPELWLSAATYPNVTNAHNSIFQDMRTWVENGWMDELFSMSYSIDNNYVYNNASLYSSFCNDNCFYSTGLSAFSDTAADDFAAQMALVRNAGADGVAVFSLGMINPSNYAYEIVEGAFRDPSVQAYKLNKTVAGGLKGLKTKIDRLAPIYTTLDDSVITKIKAKCDVIISKAEEYELESSSIKEKINYCASAITDLEGLEEYVTELCGNSIEGDNLNSDIEQLIYFITLSQARLKTR